MIEKAKWGDVTAAREVLDRTLGKPAGFVELGLLPRTDANGLRLVFNRAAEVLADGNDDNATFIAIDAPPSQHGLSGEPQRLPSGPPGAVHGPDGGKAMPVPNRVEGGR